MSQQWSLPLHADAGTGTAATHFPSPQPTQVKKKTTDPMLYRRTGQPLLLSSPQTFFVICVARDNRIRSIVLSFFYLSMKIPHTKYTFQTFQPLKIKCLLKIFLTSSVHKAYAFDKKNNLLFPIRNNLHILCYMTSQKNAFCSFTTFTLGRWETCIAYDISNSRQGHTEVYAYAEI